MMLTSSADGERAEPLLACAEDEHDDDEAHKLESQRKLKWAVGLALLFMGIEIAGGILAHSLAILTDAAHMLSDVAGFIVSIVALALTSRPPNGTFSFGYHRAEVLGAMLSIFAVWFMTGILVFEACNRLVTPQVVDGRVMGITAVAGVFLNLILMKVLGHDHHGGHGHDHGHAQGHGGHEESVQRTDAHAHDHGHKGSCKEPKPFAHHPPGDHAHAHGTRAAGVDTHSADVESGEPPSGAGHRVGVPAAAISSFDRLRTLAGFPTAAAQPTPVTGGYAIDHSHAKLKVGSPAILAQTPPPVCQEEHGHGHAHEHDRAHGHEHAHAPSHEDHGHGHGHAHAECPGDTAAPQKKKKSVAVDAAMAHVIGDLIQSIGVVVAAVLIWTLHERNLDGNGVSYWYRVDPVCTLLSAVLVLHSTWATLSECTMVLMCAVPGHIDSNDVHRRLLAMPEVIEVHDLHIWAVSPHKLNLSAHIVVRPSTDQTTVLYSAQAVAKRVGVNHTVFQVEDSALFNCSAHAGWPCLKRTSPDAAGPQ
mmetsp:Transcript_36964/g.91974  ORF Transcript_36964/g.91974 Transcript_36964/m.91974 type:complete len:533 (+) Transcript_36964:94-1692(+)